MKTIDHYVTKEVTEITFRSELWRLFNDDVVGYAAELGVAEGRFSEEMLAWPVKFPRVYLVDRWATHGTWGDSAFPQGWHEENLRTTRERVEKFGERAVILRGDSVAMAEQVPDRSFSLVYIDCDHTYEGVVRDLEAWWPKLMVGGYMALHDYDAVDYPGVRQATIEHCARVGAEIRHIPELKREDAGAYFRKGG